MNYNKLYSRFIESIPLRSKQTEQGYEVHHILPVSLGGSKYKKANLIKLTCREHFIAHRILAKMYRGKKKYKMIYALKRMCDPTRFKITARTYQHIREQFVKTMTKEWKDPNGARRKGIVKMSKSHIKLWKDKDYREHQSEIHKEWAHNNRDHYSNEMKRRWQDPEFRAKVLAKRKKLYATPEYKKKTSVKRLAKWQDPEYRSKVTAARWGV
jgi:hypothetical protein